MVAFDSRMAGGAWHNLTLTLKSQPRWRRYFTERKTLSRDFLPAVRHDSIYRFCLISLRRKNRPWLSRSVSVTHKRILRFVRPWLSKVCHRVVSLCAEQNRMNRRVTIRHGSSLRKHQQNVLPRYLSW